MADFPDYPLSSLRRPVRVDFLNWLGDQREWTTIGTAILSAGGQCLPGAAVAELPDDAARRRLGYYVAAFVREYPRTLLAGEVADLETLAEALTERTLEGPGVATPNDVARAAAAANRDGGVDSAMARHRLEATERRRVSAAHIAADIVTRTHSAGDVEAVTALVVVTAQRIEDYITNGA